ncbi:uncharacterized protein AKAW2_10328S [Aspergillus luchuensis]|uniref:Uncharacterized protein n=1 Tax=Aspergillus kawachii TaxID=1069201 RepID=A0A7R7VYU5_ASPKA|nr:uncharacterized protein AKAW2_10328S [Aspergillus luchuensis]BCR93282.1 hypothetical protein AKAW2_10328S [Aspergillus luchuensis]
MLVFRVRGTLTLRTSSRTWSILSCLVPWADSCWDILLLSIIYEPESSHPCKAKFQGNEAEQQKKQIREEQQKRGRGKKRSTMCVMHPRSASHFSQGLLMMVLPFPSLPSDFAV